MSRFLLPVIVGLLSTSLLLKAEPLEAKGRVTATASIHRSAETAAIKEMSLEFIEGEYGRILAEPGEKFTVRLNLAKHNAEKPLRISADWGGVIDREFGPKKIEKLRSPVVEFDFTVGKHRGRYNVEVMHDGERQLLEFWVGPESPQGEPGPKRTFQAPASLRAKLNK